MVRLAVAIWLLARGQHDRLPRRGLVGDLLEQVADDVQPGTLLAVGVGDVPGRGGGRGRGEHLVTGPRVLIPAAVGLEVHRRELPDLARIVDTRLDSSCLFLLTDL